MGEKSREPYHTLLRFAEQVDTLGEIENTMYSVFGYSGGAHSDAYTKFLSTMFGGRSKRDRDASTLIWTRDTLRMQLPAEGQTLVYLSRRLDSCT